MKARSGALGAWIPVVLGALLSACANHAVIDASYLRPDALPAGVVDYRKAGPRPVTTSALTVASDTGCDLRLDLLKPTGGQLLGTVVLAPGFLRDAATVTGLARHWASWGMRTAVMEPCNPSLLDGAHAANAADLNTVARRFPGQPVTYAGFSAGALAAAMAAGADPGSAGLLMLDPVDAQGRLAPAASRFNGPSFALFGQPSGCNRQGGARRLLSDAKNLQSLRLVGASHCHFEVPLDLSCLALCGGSGEETDAGPLQGLVLGFSTSALLASARPAATRQWWDTEGAALSELIRAARVEAPK